MSDLENDNKKDASSEPSRISCCQDLTAYFGNSDHSINKLHQTKVSISK